MKSPVFQKLKPLTIPLRDVNLIEASAGTGKTYTLETLFVRLLVEKRLPTHKILVVTFTHAATEELRHRIRQRLAKTLFAFQTGSKNSDPNDILSELLERYPDHPKVARFLRYALQTFDEAAIFTIHSFCLRILHDHAFESGLLFDTTLLNDQRQLLQEIVEDFWRQHFYHASPLFINYLLENKYQNPSCLLPAIAFGRYLNQPFLTMTPSPHELSMQTASEHLFYQSFTQVKTLWQTESDSVEQLLLKDASLHRSKYRKASIPEWCQTLTQYLTAPTQLFSAAALKSLQKFTTTNLSNSTNKGKLPPQHPFFDLCDTFYQCQQALRAQFADQLLTLKIELLTAAATALTHKKQQQGVQAFDDLLLNSIKALRGGNGPLLAQQIRLQYPVALIDEFQDTDPTQYQIFHSIYNDNSPTLFFIGDPKQAIYSFRGADIFTYMNARRTATRHYTLETNWRADAALVEAINTVFNRVPKPFIFDAIDFHTITASPKQTQPRLHIADHSVAPLQIWLVTKAQAECEQAKPIPKKWAEPHLARAVGYEIARLLELGHDKQAWIKKEGKSEKYLEAGDIAILVRTNAQAQSMQKTLMQLHIPSVLYSAESLFTSHEVVEIEYVLRAVAAPTEDNLLKIALTTDMLGVLGNELYRLNVEETAWQAVRKRFHTYYDLWHHAGFMQMFRTLLLDYDVAARLLTYPDGERRLTNVLHAAEILQQVALQQKLATAHLCQWLSQQRQKQTEASEEEQLRLESDEKRVKIVTIHKSKGLEYPIVFCPFVWDGRLSSRDADQFTFHDQSQDALTLDLGSPNKNEHRQQALKEELAETIRLFYVAVTRAKHRCYLVWGAFREANTSAPARLWFPELESVEDKSDGVLWHALQKLAITPAIQISLLPNTETTYQPPAVPAVELTARPFKGKIDRTWRVSSFTGLVKTTLPPDIAEHPDHDMMPSVTPLSEATARSEQAPILKFPRGAKAGMFFHALFEHSDFTQSPPDNNFIAQQLRNFAYNPEEWQTIVAHFVTDVVTTPLEPQRAHFKLTRIPVKQRLNELEFYYPIRQITAKGLKNLFIDTEYADINFKESFGRLTFAPTEGFMKGFIDMVFREGEQFYLVDYKSNFLGGSMESYHNSRLYTVMSRENYFLQYFIYVVALHRYLQLRLPTYRYEKHFGGVYYLFLRGMNPHWGAQYGIFWDKPPAALVEKLTAYLING